MESIVATLSITSSQWKGIPFISHLLQGNAQKRAVAQQLRRPAQMHQLDAGVFLFEKDAPANGIYILVEGQLELLAPGNPTIGPGQVVGEHGLYVIHQRVRRYALRAALPSKVIHIPEEVLLEPGVQEILEPWVYAQQVQYAPESPELDSDVLPTVPQPSLFDLFRHMTEEELLNNRSWEEALPALICLCGMFDGITVTQAKWLAKSAVVQVLPEGKPFMQQGNPATSVWMLAVGEYQIGGLNGPIVHQPGSVVGERGLLTPYRTVRAVEVATTQPSLLVMWPDELFTDNPEVSHSMVHPLHRRVVGYLIKKDIPPVTMEVAVVSEVDLS